MNANELADEIKNFYSHTNQPYFLIQLETMLRQQQAEIESLRHRIVKYELDEMKRKTNNEPVAWWDGKEPSVLGLSYFKNDYCPIPLYTHPAKTLTDEEIKFIASFYQIQGDVLDFAKALLKKASEK